MQTIVGPVVVTKEGGFGFDLWTSEEGLSRGFSYRCIEDAYDRLIDMLRRAAEPGKHRVRTRPTAASRERRREAKLARGRTKRLRQSVARLVDT